jgi:hypothetical protein
MEMHHQEKHAIPISLPGSGSVSVWSNAAFPDAVCLNIPPLDILP